MDRQFENMCERVNRCISIGNSLRIEKNNLDKRLYDLAAERTACRREGFSDLVSKCENYIFKYTKQLNIVEAKIQKNDSVKNRLIEELGKFHVGEYQALRQKLLNL